MQNVSEATFLVEWRDTSEKDVVSKGTCVFRNFSVLLISHAVDHLRAAALNSAEWMT